MASLSLITNSMTDNKTNLLEIEFTGKFKGNNITTNVKVELEIPLVPHSVEYNELYRELITLFNSTHV